MLTTTGAWAPRDHAVVCQMACSRPCRHGHLLRMHVLQWRMRTEGNYSSASSAQTSQQGTSSLACFNTDFICMFKPALSNQLCCYSAQALPRALQPSKLRSHDTHNTRQLCHRDMHVNATVYWPMRAHSQILCQDLPVTAATITALTTSECWRMCRAHNAYSIATSCQTRGGDQELMLI
jgi:hypothetical protein